VNHPIVPVTFRNFSSYMSARTLTSRLIRGNALSSKLPLHHHHANIAALPRLQQLSQHTNPNARVGAQSTKMATASIPKTQKGVIIEKNGGTEVLQYKTDLEVPTPGEGEILVKNEYVGVNFIDTSVSPSLPS
jgi:hypothetical protein